MKMQTTIHVTQPVKMPELSAMTHEQKKDLIQRCIQVHAKGTDFWMTYSEIAECTGLTRKEVKKTMYASGTCFLESSWRMADGEILVTVRQLYEDRTSFFEKVLAAFTGQRD